MSTASNMPDESNISSWRSKHPVEVWILTKKGLIYLRPVV